MSRRALTVDRRRPRRRDGRAALRGRERSPRSGPDVAPEPGDETIDAGGAPLVPPLVNGHTHAAMTLFRGYGGDLPLMRWLQETIWPVEAKLDAEDVYWGTRLACAGDDPHRHRPLLGHVLAARRRPRARSTTPACGRRSAAPLFDADGDTEAMQATALREPRRARPRSGRRIGAALAPARDLHGQRRRSLRWIARAGRRARRAGPDPPLRDRAGGRATASPRHGVRPAAYLDRLGLLGERTVLAHGVWLDRERAGADRRARLRPSSPTRSPT